MYQRPHNRGKDGKAHAYWSLVETMSAPDSPCQGTLCYPDELNGSEQARWVKTVVLVAQQHRMPNRSLEV